MTLETILLFSVCGIVYTYVGYPLLLYLVSRTGSDSVERSEIYPSVTLVISARNEEKVILKKLENSLGIDYPKDRLQIIVISDASNDGTDDIVLQHREHRVRLVRLEKRRGKSAGLNEGFRVAEGDIVLMTDANSMLEKNAVRELVKGFADPRVGFVTGWTRYDGGGEEGVGHSVGLYTRFENSLKDMESVVASCVGADGAIFGIRRALYEPLRDHDINDFVLPLKIVKKGYRGIFEERAVCREEMPDKSGASFRRQVRITNRTLRAILAHREILNPWRYGWFAIGVLSHKLLRFLSPYFLLGALVCSFLLAERGGNYLLLLGAQGLFYICGAIGFFTGRDRRGGRILALCSDFVMVSGAYLGGWVKLLGGSLDTVWDRAR